MLNESNNQSQKYKKDKKEQKKVCKTCSTWSICENSGNVFSELVVGSGEPDIKHITFIGSVRPGP